MRFRPPNPLLIATFKAATAVAKPSFPRELSALVVANNIARTAFSCSLLSSRRRHCWQPAVSSGSSHTTVEGIRPTSQLGSPPRACQRRRSKSPSRARSFSSSSQASFALAAYSLSSSQRANHASSFSSLSSASLSSPSIVVDPPASDTAANGRSNHSRRRIDSLHPKQLDTMIAPITMNLRESIALSEKEERICSTLMAVVTHYGMPTVMRIAGGWVRDKLLGLESSDLDIALDDCTGVHFANKVNDFLKLQGEQTNRIGVIASNPDQSKHLETATVKIYDLPIDFVNLRSETYETESRIPKMEFGSPMQDAYRRDITINALFYNINTRSVEDFTGMGISDLKEGFVRTPLPCKDTFLDDPLRILRVIRFGSRYGFAIDEAIVAGVKDVAVRDAFEHKISRERVGIELEKMLKGPDPSRAICLLNDFELFDLTFNLPPPAKSLEAFKDICLGSAAVRHSRTITWILKNSHSIRELSKPHQMLLFLAACLVPHRNQSYKDAKNKVFVVVKVLIKEHLKLPTAVADNVSLALERVDEFRSAVETNTAFPISRVKAGLLLRESKTMWPISLALATAMEIDASLGSNEEGTRLDDNENAHEILRRSLALISLIDEYKLHNVWEEKALVDGQRLQKLLNVKAGPAIKPLLDKVINWQLEHPELGQEECEAWLLASNGP